MQFHLNGFEAGDPEISNPAERLVRSGSPGGVPENVDVLIVGCGPAGLTLAAQLSAFADIKTCIVEQRTGPLLRGQADGIACRTIVFKDGQHRGVSVTVKSQGGVNKIIIDDQTRQRAIDMLV